MALDNWTDHHRAAIEWIPFASMWMGTRATDRPLLTKAFEQFALAAAAAAVAIYVNDKVQDVRLSDLTARVAEIKADTRADIAALRADIAAMRADLRNE
jgi:hypothetical protein